MKTFIWFLPIKHYFWVKKFIPWHVEIASTNIAPIVFRCHMFGNFQFILTVTIDDMNKQYWGENQYESFCVKYNRAYTLGIVVVNYGISLLGQGHSCFFFLLSSFFFHSGKLDIWLMFSDPSKMNCFGLFHDSRYLSLNRYFSDRK